MRIAVARIVTASCVVIAGWLLGTGCATEPVDVGSRAPGADGGGGFAAADAAFAPDSSAGLCPTNECPKHRTSCPSNPFPCAVDLRTDDANCGACGVRCPGLADDPFAARIIFNYAARWRCEDSTCRMVCENGRADCNGIVEDGCETNIVEDRDNCGTCGKHCQHFCSAASCDCPPGKTYCEAAGCVDLANDDKNCKTCGNACPAGAPVPTAWHAGRGCRASTCDRLKCEERWGDCNGNLEVAGGDGCEIYLSEDPKNCGTCGNACAPGQTCFFGTCVCKPGEYQCSTDVANTSTCAQLDTDPDHCGACNRRCPGDDRSGGAGSPDLAHGQRSCTQGVCGFACSPAFGDCDHNIDNGCETPLLDDPLNCGGCQIRCDGVVDQACVNGVCTTRPCEVR